MPGRRNPKWIALGVVALCLGALLSYLIYSKVATETSVVALAQTVYRGEQIEAGDLATVVVQGDTLRDTVPARDRDSLIGKRAGFDLPAGSVLSRTSVTDTAVPEPGSAVVGLKLAAGRAPAALLLPSSPVRLVALPQSGTEINATDKLAGKTYVAQIIDKRDGADGTSIEVNVTVASDQAPTIALLAAQDRIAVVRDPGK